MPKTVATALALVALELVNRGLCDSGMCDDGCCNDTLPWDTIAYGLGGTTVLFMLTTCTLSICLCVVACRKKNRRNAKDLQPLVHQASFSVPLSNQVYAQNEKGTGRTTEGPGSTNTFAPPDTTDHPPPSKRNSTTSSIASGGYVEMSGGGLKDIITSPSFPAVSHTSVPAAANPGQHSGHGLEHTSPLQVQPLDYENATAWFLAEKIKEQNRIDCIDPINLPTTKSVATYHEDRAGNDHQPTPALALPYPRCMDDAAHQAPKLPPKRYKEIEFMMMEPTSEYMKPNISPGSLPREAKTDFSFKTDSRSNTLGRV